MKSLCAYIQVGLVVVLGLQGVVAGETGLVGSGPAAGGASKLVYVFSAASPHHWERARALELLAPAQAQPLQMIGVVTGLQDGVSVTEVLSGARRNGLTCVLMDGRAAEVCGLLVEVHDVGSAGDWALLVDGSGKASSLGGGQEVERALTMGLLVSTDVNESTWGKIKELFQ